MRILATHQGRFEKISTESGCNAVTPSIVLFKTDTSFPLALDLLTVLNNLGHEESPWIDYNFYLQSWILIIIQQLIPTHLIDDE